MLKVLTVFAVDSVKAKRFKVKVNLEKLIFKGFSMECEFLFSLDFFKWNILNVIEYALENG